MSALDDHPESKSSSPALDATAVHTLVGSHRALLAFVEKRVGSRALAEDILQDAFVRGLTRSDDVESTLAWFYRVLRNAIIDRGRRLGAERRALDAFARELGDSTVTPVETRQTACQCLLSLAQTLEPSYQSAIQRVDVEGQSVKEFALAEGISDNNASVRLHRARRALRKRVMQSCGTCAEHGCLDCHCGAAVPR